MSEPINQAIRPLPQQLWVRENPNDQTAVEHCATLSSLLEEPTFRTLAQDWPLLMGESIGYRLLADTADTVHQLTKATYGMLSPSTSRDILAATARYYVLAMVDTSHLEDENSETLAVARQALKRIFRCKAFVTDVLHAEDLEVLLAHELDTIPEDLTILSAQMSAGCLEHEDILRRAGHYGAAILNTAAIYIASLPYQSEYDEAEIWYGDLHINDD